MNISALERLSPKKKAAIITAGIAEFSVYAYSDANTERITAACGISKGLLYHYFGTKKDFYLYCVDCTLKTLTSGEPMVLDGDFYTVLFTEMERKIQLCAQHPNETLFISLAARESTAEVSREIRELLGRYSAQMRQRSLSTLEKAIGALRLSVPLEDAVEALLIYSGAIMNRYLAQYQNKPEVFLAAKTAIKKEINRYLDLMLYGICEGEIK